MVAVRPVLLGVQVIADVVDVGVRVFLVAKDGVNAGLDFPKDGVHGDAVGDAVSSRGLEKVEVVRTERQPREGEAGVDVCLVRSSTTSSITASDAASRNAKTQPTDTCIGTVTPDEVQQKLDGMPAGTSSSSSIDSIQQPLVARRR